MRSVGSGKWMHLPLHPYLDNCAPAALVTLDNLGPIACPPRQRRLIRMSALSTFYQGAVVA
uniref:Uncharacterized protein n=1 Tax=Denticeps clupeoides TaxID=299321 RepID=A0AAY4A4C4_9TELE